MSSASQFKVSDSQRGGRWGVLAVFGATSAVYLLLRSHDMMAVDGAIRAFMVYRKPLVVTVNPHMLYQLWVWLWVRMLSAFGYVPAGPLEYFRAVQAMNCLAAAACAAILFQLIREFTGSLKIAAFGAVAWAFGHVVMLHATNSAEPMLGLLWSVVAFALTARGLRRQSYFMLVVAGVSLAVAMASYKSMVFIGLACGLMTLLWPTPSRLGEAVKRAVTLTAGFVVSSTALLGYVAWKNGARSLHDGMQMFMQVDAEGVYLGVKPTKIVNSLVGYANAFVVAVPSNYAGLRWLATSHRGWIPWLGSCLIVVMALTFVLLRSGIAVRDRERQALYIGCGAAFLLGLFLLWSWDPIYHKLWLQPLWLMVLMLSVASASASIHLKRMLPGVVIALVAVNLCAAAGAARGGYPGVEESKRVATMIQPNDLVIGGWTTVAVMYRNIWASESQSMDFPYEASTTGPRSITTLQKRVEEARARGGNVYFLDVMDQDETSWNAFLGERCGVPYEAMRTYRERVREVAHFASNGTTVTLRELQ